MAHYAIALVIYLIIPITGLIAYLLLVKTIEKEHIADPPFIDLFFVFATYGGLLLVILTSLLWQWSGMASIGTFYLIICAPVLMWIVASRNRKRTELSKYHNWAYRMGYSYFIIALVTFGMLYFFLE